MIKAKIHSGDTVDFRHIILDENDDIVNISNPQTLTLNFIKPDGTTFSRDATLLTNGLDGVLRYKTLTADLDVQGDWFRQAYVKTLGGEWTAKLFKFVVYRKVV